MYKVCKYLSIFIIGLDDLIKTIVDDDFEILKKKFW